MSIMSIIAEGFDRGRRAEFHQFLSVAKGSTAELRSQQYSVFDAGLLDEGKFRALVELGGHQTDGGNAQSGSAPTRRANAPPVKFLSPES